MLLIFYRNFEEKTVGQIKTVYPTAYTYRQQKGLRFGNGKTYELTVEPDLAQDLGTVDCFLL